jgi:hypothetical protein
MKVETQLYRENKHGRTRILLKVKVDGRPQDSQTIILISGPTYDTSRCQGIGHLDPEETSLETYAQLLGMKL